MKICVTFSYMLMCEAGCMAHTMGRMLVLTGKISLTCARLTTGHWTGDHFVGKLSTIGQLTRLTRPLLSSFWGQWMSSNPCKKWVTEVKGKNVVRGVVHHSHERVFLATDQSVCSLLAQDNLEWKWVSATHLCSSLWDSLLASSYCGLYLTYDTKIYQNIVHANDSTGAQFSKVPKSELGLRFS